jgi:phosphoglycolate phosphatase
MSATSEALEQNGFNMVVDEKSYNFGARYVTPERLAWHATGQRDDACGPVLAVAFEKYVAELVTTKNTPLYAGIIGLLEHLSMKEHLSLGVLSNASGCYVHNVIRHHQLQGTFKTSYGADNVPDAKPQPDGLNVMLLDFQVQASNCIYVGDSPTDGMAASGARMYSIGVTWGNNAHGDLEAHFDEIVSTITELQLAIDTFFDNKSKAAQTIELEGVRESLNTEKLEPRRRVSWQNDVIDNEHMNKFRTDDEYWDGSS